MVHLRGWLNMSTKRLLCKSCGSGNYKAYMVDLEDDKSCQSCIELHCAECGNIFNAGVMGGHPMGMEYFEY